MLLLGTIAIQLGWAVHTAYEKLIDMIIDLGELSDHHEIITDISVVRCAAQSFAR